MMIGLAALALVVGVAKGQDCEPGCTGDLEADINRIEYQIPMDHTQLRGDTINEVDAFMEYLDEILEDQLFYGIFDIKKDKSKMYFRSDRTKEVEASNRDYPKFSGIKYRQTEDEGWYEKYQNDLSWQMGLGKSCANVEPEADYVHVYKCKNEANMFPDSCITVNGGDDMVGSDYMNDGGNGFTGRLEFDDDDQWGHNTTDAVRMVRESCFTAFPFDCENSCLDDFYVDACERFYNGIVAADGTISTDKDVYNYVLDVDFEINFIDEFDVKTEVSEGKLTFQVRFDTKSDWNNDLPTGRETEMSVKCRRDETEDGYWDYVVEKCNAITDAITRCGYPWVRYDGCNVNGRPGDCPTTRPTMSPTHSPGYVPHCCQASSQKRRWKGLCAGLSEADCGQSRRYQRNCEWVEEPCLNV